MFRRCIVLTSVVVELVAFCSAQSTPPSPGPLTAGYSFQDVSFRYPSNWIVRAHVNSLAIGPPWAFIQRSDGRDFVTHGLFLWVVSNPTLPLDEMTIRSALSFQHNAPQLQINTTELKHAGNPPWSSCASTLDPNPPYQGTETGNACTFKVGTVYVLTMMFSPTTVWGEYSPLFERVASTFSVRVDNSADANSPIRQSVEPPSRSRPTGGCESGHWITSVEADGQIIKLEDGSLWNVDSVDTVTTSIWLPVSNVVICGSKMINVDDSESAEVTPIGTENPAGARSQSTHGSFVIQASADDETFVINDNVFKAQTYCFNFDQGDKVIFVEGSPLGACASAKLLNLRTEKVCSVWCE